MQRGAPLCALSSWMTQRSVSSLTILACAATLTGPAPPRMPRPDGDAGPLEFAAERRRRPLPRHRRNVDGEHWRQEFAAAKLVPPGAQRTSQCGRCEVGQGAH